MVLFRGLPPPLFIGRLKRVYGECEVKLDTVRTDLFELIKRKDNCPYKSSDIKKRIQTRNGELIADKLGRDIHTLLAVIDGAEFFSNEMRELVTIKKSSNRPSVSRPSSTDTQSPARPKLHNDNVLLQDAVSGLRADLLCFKQKYRANETARSEQIKILKETSISLKSDLSGIRESLSTQVNEIKLCVHRIESERGSGITKIKNDLKVLHNNLRSVEENLDCAVANISNRIDCVTSKKGGSKKGGKQSISYNAPPPALPRIPVIDLCSQNKAKTNENSVRPGNLSAPQNSQRYQESVIDLRSPPKKNQLEVVTSEAINGTSGESVRSTRSNTDSSDTNSTRAFPKLMTSFSKIPIFDAMRYISKLYSSQIQTKGLVRRVVFLQTVRLTRPFLQAKQISK